MQKHNAVVYLLKIMHKLEHTMLGLYSLFISRMDIATTIEATRIIILVVCIFLYIT